jgi:hypothetical protein
MLNAGVSSMAAAGHRLFAAFWLTANTGITQQRLRAAIAAEGRSHVVGGTHPQTAPCHWRATEGASDSRDPLGTCSIGRAGP